MPFVMPALVSMYAVAVTMLSVMKPSQDAPPTTTSGESSYGYTWEWSSAVPETTDVNQFYVLVGHAFSPLQIQQFCADAKSIYAEYMPVMPGRFDYWNYWFAKEVQEISMYDKLQNLYQDFETMIAFFPYFWKIWEIMLTQVVNVVFLKFFGRARLELFLTNIFLRLTKIFLRMFEQMLYLLWG